MDSQNYIKGFRYELHCLARNNKTTMAVVFCDTDFEIAKLNCEKGGYENPHPIELFIDYA